MARKIKLAVVTGGHPFNVPAFRDMFARMEGFDVYHQDLDNWAASKRDETYDLYDVFLFYNMNFWGIFSVRDDMEQRIRDAIAGLGESGQGIVVLHHALLSFVDMKAFTEVCGVEDRKLEGFGLSHIRTEIADPGHPITAGLEPWEMDDEYFTIGMPNESCKVLLITSHPASTKALGWTHELRNARVFCYQSGHGPGAYTNASYQTVLRRGIEWAARR